MACSLRIAVPAQACDQQSIEASEALPISRNNNAEVKMPTQL